MRRIKVSRGKLLPAFFIIAVFIDQVTKIVVQEHLMLHESLTVIPGFFSITYILNPGAAFGIFQNSSPLIRKIFLLVAALFACVALLYFLRKEYSYKFRSFVYVLIMAGAAGNAIDRLRLDKVVDFLDFYYKTYHWYTFNVADCYITVGVFLLLAESFADKNKISGG